MEDIIYENAIPEKLVSSSTGENKSKKVSKGEDRPTKATKKNKVNDGKAKASGSASRKRKVTKEETPEQTNSAKKNKVNDGKVKASGSSSRGYGKKDSPKKKDACAGMKNFMSQFVKKLPVDSTASTPNDAKTSSSSQ